ncbi:hypothetical protein SKAU_G00141550 [Synaphobranchus kaupii]|uniref:Uncharacterized protein n=1 Tax=Synaphobranchus kaupii TaxID=118154 RepID=A0A9Q1FSV1_SYNKA|nr:hypothetical protein SKAU_G00141550 [Synaphobranchus kaupii]
MEGDGAGRGWGSGGHVVTSTRDHGAVVRATEQYREQLRSCGNPKRQRGTLKGNPGGSVLPLLIWRAPGPTAPGLLSDLTADVNPPPRADVNPSPFTLNAILHFKPLFFNPHLKQLFS